jgi:C-terminal processing protease CtpA/Prc
MKMVEPKNKSRAIIFGSVVLVALLITSNSNTAFAQLPTPTPVSPKKERQSKAVNEIAIIEVVSGSPAEKAGLKVGDTVVAIDGKAVASIDDLSKAVNAKKIGDTLALEVQNANGEKRTVNASLAENPNKTGVVYLGVRYGYNIDRHREPRDFDRRPFSTQIAILEVLADSPAAKAGVQKGDVVTEVNGVSVVNFAALSQVVKRAKPGDKVTLKILRGGDSKSIEVTLGENPNQKGVTYLGVTMAPRQLRTPIRPNPTPLPSGGNG